LADNDASLASRSSGVKVNGKFFITIIEEAAKIFLKSGSCGFDLDLGLVREREPVRDRWEEEEEDKEGVRLDTGDATLSEDCECRLNECKLYAPEGLF